MTVTYDRIKMLPWDAFGNCEMRKTGCYEKNTGFPLRIKAIRCQAL